MAFQKLAVLAVVALAALGHAQNQTTWVETTFVTENYRSTTTTQYDTTPHSPIIRSTGISHFKVYSNTTIRKDRSFTHWVTDQVTFPVTTYTAATTTTLSTPLSVRSNGTSTVVSWVSSALATVTFWPANCYNVGGENGTQTTVTKYTGTYSQFSGQITAAPTVFPTAVTTQINVTGTYRVVTSIGSIVTVSSTATGSNWLSTSTVSSNKTVTVAPFRTTGTVYDHTITVTSSDWHLAYTTVYATVLPCGPTRTITRAAQCAPTNLISQRDGHGVGVRCLPRDWVFPIEFFPPKLLGIPDYDASSCCQLCADNPGCAASEWSSSWSTGCMLYYYAHGNDTCGATQPLEYFSDIHTVPDEGSSISNHCGRLTYLGRMDPFCPDCKVTDDIKPVE
ncbi:hypothetical protein Sste5346_007573 [Sporothrix stenoceras]|uniref:Apple domain-containing protein n=1 Tax=Sporothrix stenoceras TaxID=5173 RepID=A0ABR3YTT4_9PEZI